MYQEFNVEPKAASCVSKLFLEPKKNQEWSFTGRGLFLIAMADIVKEIKATCTILGFPYDMERRPTDQPHVRT
jgi:hypothetical protein